MTVKDFLKKPIDIAKIADLYADKNFLEIVTRDEKTDMSVFKNNIKNKVEKFIAHCMEKETTPNDNVIFVTTLQELDTNTRELYDVPSVFMCNKSQIIKKVQRGDITLWNGDEINRIEHYGVDMMPLGEILSSDIISDLDDITTLFYLIDEITIFGFDEPEREKRINNMIETIEQSIDELENGETVTFTEEEVFESLRDRLEENLSTEEKERLAEARRKRNYNYELLKKYNTALNHMNHHKVIHMVYSYFVSLRHNEKYFE